MSEDRKNMKLTLAALVIEFFGLAFMAPFLIVGILAAWAKTGFMAGYEFIVDFMGKTTKKSIKKKI